MNYYKASRHKTTQIFNVEYILKNVNLKKKIN